MNKTISYLEHKITKDSQNSQIHVDGYLFEYVSDYKSMNSAKKELREAIRDYLDDISDYSGLVYTRRGTHYYEYRNDGQFTSSQKIVGRAGYTSRMQRFDSLESLCDYRKIVAKWV